MGALAFAPLVLVLAPVLAQKSEANMAKGMLGVIVSFMLLLGGLLCAYLASKAALLAFVAGELAGFFVGLVAVALWVIAKQ